jgi:hypothetical protein
MSLIIAVPDMGKINKTALELIYEQVKSVFIII